MVDITPEQLFDKRPVPATAAGGEPDYLGSLERILDKADQLLSKVAMSRGMSLQPGKQAGGGVGIGEIKTALETVKSVKGDIPISELLKLLSENAALVEGVLKK
ncbi:hypothetical protein [Methanolobus sp.]|uniref:hypothetical protein n=1 Tax=Methanolobus sp. TaxID=1874737 RepID=UPI0025FBE1E3|nr:hypothetical protein [Methanolobus sp.]